MVHSSCDFKSSNRIIELAKKLLLARLKVLDVSFTGAEDVKNFLTLVLAEEEREVFSVLFLNAQNQLIEFQKMFMGTITSVEIYPREIVRQAMKLNASALILSHNHPSGFAEPSPEDIKVTRNISKVGELLSLRVLDHIIVAKSKTVSFAERGLI